MNRHADEHTNEHAPTHAADRSPRTSPTPQNNTRPDPVAPGTHTNEHDGPTMGSTHAAHPRNPTQRYATSSNRPFSVNWGA